MTRPRPSNSKLTTNVYEKKFNSFKEMVDELKTIHPEFGNIFIYDDEEVAPKDAADDVLAYFSKNAPDVINRKCLPVSVSISSNRVTLKTAKFFTVGWQFKFDKNGFISDLSVRLTTFTKDDKVSDTMANMIECLENSEDWTKLEFEKHE